jgi:hypothetical protein
MNLPRRMWEIYTLSDPRTNEIRYVGFTTQGAKERLRRHIWESLKYRRSHRHRWVNSLINAGVVPIINVIESGSGDGWSAVERKWIAFYRSSGARLVNFTDGGEGALARGTAEYRSGIRRKQIASTTPEQRSEAARKGYANRTPEQRIAGGKAAAANSTKEQRSERSRTAAIKRYAGLTPEQRREAMHEAWKYVPSESKRRASKRTWEAMTPEAKLDFIERRRIASNKSRRENSKYILSYDGKSLHVDEWGKLTGLNAKTIRNRLKSGWPIGEALSKPSEKRLLNYNGELLTAKELALRIGLKEATVQARARHGWDVERIISTPLRKA